MLSGKKVDSFVRQRIESKSAGTEVRPLAARDPNSEGGTVSKGHENTSGAVWMLRVSTVVVVT